ncbi:MAG: hypothetical protein Q7U13_08065, partial [Rhodoferax sp.]|nr:hypothetical protein [Rhodoferax sp.]
MKRWMKIAVGLLALPILLAAAPQKIDPSAFIQTAEAEYQGGADAKRVNDVHKIAELLDAYQLKTGRLPFHERVEQPGALAATVIIGAPKVERELPSQGNPLGQDAITLSSSDLLAVLRPVLGADLELPIDPQRARNGAPNAYYVRFKRGGRYLVAGFLRTPRAYSSQEAPTVFAYALRSGAPAVSMGHIWDKARTTKSISG